MARAPGIPAGHGLGRTPEAVDNVPGATVAPGWTVRESTPRRMPGSSVTYHLAPQPVWEAQRDDPGYLPEAFGREGFIHCTDGLDQIVASGNRHLRNDPRPYLLVTIRVEALTSPVRYEDPNRIYPHIYGPLNREAVVEVEPALRDPDGRFLPIAG